MTTQVIFNPTIWDGKVFIFARDMVGGMLSPTVHAEEVCSTLQDRILASEADVDTDLLALNSSATEEPATLLEGDQARLSVSTMAPYQLVVPLLKPSFFSPPGV